MKEGITVSLPPWAVFIEELSKVNRNAAVRVGLAGGRDFRGVCYGVTVPPDLGLFLARKAGPFLERTCSWHRVVADEVNFVEVHLDADLDDEVLRRICERAAEAARRNCGLEPDERISGTSLLAREVRLADFEAKEGESCSSD